MDVTPFVRREGYRILNDPSEVVRQAREDMVRGRFNSENKPSLKISDIEMAELRLIENNLLPATVRSSALFTLSRWKDGHRDRYAERKPY